ncbi:MULTISPECIES: hypothetical protein [unclassified Luteibacter]|uniref:hypothetical protein n=1 Tax=Luteibacter sp. PvP019 TaxID=3156436 RepID=UPI003391A146
MNNRFDRRLDQSALERLGPGRAAAVAAAALDRMSVGYGLWAPPHGHTPVNTILDSVWHFVIEGSGLPVREVIERLYPSPDVPPITESPYAESFLESFELLVEFSKTREIRRLVEIREAAYNMADRAAGQVLFSHLEVAGFYKLTAEMDRMISHHPWVDRELSSQEADVLEADRLADFHALIKCLRERARSTPVISSKQLHEIKFLQG